MVVDWRGGLELVRRLAAAAVVVAAAGCSSGQPAPQPQPTTTPATTTGAPSHLPARPAKPPATSPLTGRRGVPRGPVLAVKIDNTAAGRPQIGLEAADVVYVEQVEAGQTRLIAVYASRYPRRVGPVRSVRNTDPEMLSAYGRAGLVFSGGAGAPLATLHRSALRDLAGSGVYSRDYSGGRHAPYNLIADLRTLSTRVPKVARVRDVGFRWNGRDPRLATARHALRVRAQVGRVMLAFSFDPRTHLWVRTIGGVVEHTESGAKVATANVIVQFCRVSVDRSDVDVLGAPSAYTHSVGSGPAVVLRDGRVIPGRWVRPKAGAPTRYYDAAGKEITLRPGGAWVLLSATGSPPRYG